MKRFSLTTGGLPLAFILLSALSTGAAAPDGGRFFQRHCVDCHQGSDAEAGLDLTALSSELDRQGGLERWVRVLDRVRLGDMPPKDAAAVPKAERDHFVEQTGRWLREHQLQQWREVGRVRGRRLTNLQLERTLHDLLGIDIPLAALMPEEPAAAGFNTTADRQTMSRFHLQEHLKVVDAALDEGFRRALYGDKPLRRVLPAARVARPNNRRRNRMPELREGLAVTWSARVAFYGQIRTTKAWREGWYRYTVRARALNCPPAGGVWCSVRSGLCVSSAPLLSWVGAFRATPEMQEWTFEAWMPKGHMLEIRPSDATLRKARFRGGQVGAGEGDSQNVPGLGIESVTIERIHQGADDAEIRRLLLDDLRVEIAQRAGFGPKAWPQAKLVSTQRGRDLTRLLMRFARRAFRRPVQWDEVAPYVQHARKSLEKNKSLLSALRVGYRSLLCSPRFLYLNEKPGDLDDYALASRLSYFLWNTMPDDELLKLAERKQLTQPAVLRKQVARMLRHSKGRKFAADFAAQWLDLSQIDFTTPDRRLYPDFDPIVQHSMVEETERYLQDLLDRNASVRLLIESNHTFLNERLARYYKISGVTGDRLERTQLKPEDRRGGVLTQGAILKVTANGTNTSPVLRGVWVSERLLGEEVPPPPAGVAAIEPDIRGAKSIREMLAKHKADASCAACHRTIDPPGFALENFDAAGRWRWRYVQRKGRRVLRGAKVDASGELTATEKFGGLRGFQKLVAQRPAKLASNVAKQLIAYGTGAPVTFADRPDVEAIVQRAKPSKFGLQTLVQEVVCSRAFRIK